ncbi:unnamed protein product [Jaminaea pallidilutea]
MEQATPESAPAWSGSAFASSSSSSAHPHALRSANLAANAHSVTSSSSYRRATQLSRPFIDRLDLVQELGGKIVADHEGSSTRNRRGAGSHIGHSGCVNALCWSQSGQMLASGSDDTRVILWKLGTSHVHPIADQPHMPRSRPWIGSRSSVTPAVSAGAAAADHPALDLGMSSVIQTGHTANIFSVAFAPHSSDRRLFTASGDSQIRIFDLERNGSMGGERVSIGSSWYDRYDQLSGGVECRALRCHRRRAKRLATENSPDIFMSVAEDGDVRLHDLRTSHQCRVNCPRPLLHSATSLYSLTVSPLQPYLFAVAGMSPYTYLYDRRMVGRALEDEWGQPLQPGEDALLTKCVRRFGLPKGGWNSAKCRTQDQPDPEGEDQDEGETMASNTVEARRRRLRRLRMQGNDHITAVKLGEKKAAELLATYSGNGVFRFNINDDPGVLQHRGDGRLQDGNVTMESSQQRTTGASPSSSEKKRKNSGPSQGTIVEEEADAKRQRASKGADTAGVVSAGVEQPTESLPAVDGPNTAEINNDGGDDAASSSESTVSSEDSPTEQELNDFPLYRQLLADGEAEGLEPEDSDSDEENGDGTAGGLQTVEQSDDESSEEEEDMSDSSEEEEDEDEDEDSEPDYDPVSFDEPPPTVNPQAESAPLVYPRQRYTGHMNVETVKEVNFLGAQDEYVVSGSDDGHFFIWDSETSKLLGIWQGDGSVVNVVVPHPTLPVLAVSGIDDSVKIFGPGSGRRGDEDEGDTTAKRDGDDPLEKPTTYSRWAQRDQIVRRNERRTIRRLESDDEGEDGDADDADDDSDSDEDDDGLFGRLSGPGGFSLSERFLSAAFQGSLGRSGTGDDDEDDDGDGDGGEGGERSRHSRVRLIRREDGSMMIVRERRPAGAGEGQGEGGEEQDAEDCSVM